jgi:hypothetical protein
MKEFEAEFEPPDGIAKGGSVIVLYPRCRIANVAKYGLAGTCNERLSQKHLVLRPQKIGRFAYAETMAQYALLRRCCLH